jgi:hypothetical protein
MGLSDRHASDHPSAEQLAWLAALPTTMRPSKDVLLVHGTPGNDLAYFLETVTEEGLREATREEVEHRAGTIDAALILCGHTHLQRVMTLDDGRMIITLEALVFRHMTVIDPTPTELKADRRMHVTQSCPTKLVAGR